MLMALLFIIFTEIVSAAIASDNPCFTICIDLQNSRVYEADGYDNYLRPIKLKIDNGIFTPASMLEINNVQVSEFKITSRSGDCKSSKCVISLGIFNDRSHFVLELGNSYQDKYVLSYAYTPGVGSNYSMTYRMSEFLVAQNITFINTKNIITSNYEDIFDLKKHFEITSPEGLKQLFLGDRLGNCRF